jgi:SAM-dependent methyltransferase
MNTFIEGLRQAWDIESTLFPKNFSFRLRTFTAKEKMEYEKLMHDEYVGTKVNRRKRLAQKKAYIRHFMPELFRGGGFVLDLGPGPGEFLEIARSYGNAVLGMDATMDDSEMGDEYIQLSRLLTQKQGIPVLYSGITVFLEKEMPLPFADNYFTHINSQGSIEQIFHNYLIGIPHRVLKGSVLSWNMEARTLSILSKFFEEIARVLMPGGIFFIYANGTKNEDEFEHLIGDIVQKIGSLSLLPANSKRIFKIKKDG